MKEYKTFKDLEFLPHILNSGVHAVLQFDNGYTASVICDTSFYSNGIDTYEIACVKDGHCIYPNGTSFEDDVCGYRTEEEITELMKEIQDLPPVRKESLTN